MRYSDISGYENYLKAQRTYIRSGIRPRLFFHLQIWGYTVVGALCLLLFAPHAFRSEFHLGAFVGYIVGCGLLGGGIVGAVLLPWQRRRFYRIFNGEDKVLHLYMEVDTSTLILGRLGRAETRLERAAVCKVLEGDEPMLLFMNKKKFVFIPKSIGEPALNDLRAWLRLPGARTEC